MSHDVQTNAVTLSIKSLFYIVAVIGSAIAAFGAAGIVCAALVLLMWVAILHSWDDLVGAMRGRHAVILGLIVLLYLYLLFLLLPDIGSGPASSRGICENRVRNLVWAMEAYKVDHGTYPPAFTTNDQGERRHSWRVLLLPYLEYQSLYDAYDFDEPWDGPKNSKLSKTTPAIFSCPKSGTDEGLSNYELVVTSTEDPAPLLIVEAPRAVPWMKPTAISPEGFLQSVSGRSPNVPWTFGHHREEWFTDCGWAFCAAILRDERGHVIWSRDNVDQRVLKSLGKTAHGPVKIMPQRRWRINRQRIGECVAMLAFVAVATLPGFDRWRSGQRLNSVVSASSH